ncbi:hypothetical protein, partial [Georgenia yuyongxinii]
MGTVATASDGPHLHTPDGPSRPPTSRPPGRPADGSAGRPVDPSAKLAAARAALNRAELAAGLRTRL